VSVRGLAAADVDPALLDRYADLGVVHVGVTLPVADLDRAVTTLNELARRCPQYLS